MTNVTATLVFDSWLDSAPERRSRKTEDRHLIYEGGGIILDLLLKQSGQEDRVRMGGQILFADSYAGSVAGVSIQVKPGGQTLTTKTNALGEFSFQSVPQMSIELCIMLPGQRVSVRCLTLDAPHQWQVVPVMDAGGAL